MSSRVLPTDEREPLLGDSSTSQRPLTGGADHEYERGRADGDAVSTRIARRLYVSHFLSTWNSRVFEFGATLYLATIFPHTLLPLSIYALIRGLSAIIFSPAVGQYIDKSNRLQCVRVSIIVQRSVVAASCAIFWVLAHRVPLSHGVRAGLLALLSSLACVEKLCSIMNLVSVERDWVVVVAEKDESSLRRLNAQMRRIDLICKLIGPLFIALIDGISTELAIIVNFGMNTLSVAIEFFAIARVYHEVPALQEPKSSQQPRERRERDFSLAHNLRHVNSMARSSAQDFIFYFRHQAFLPSFAGACLYLTVLSFAGQMVTYLLSAGYSASNVGLTRTLAVVFEILATWVAPWLMGWIGPIRAGAWLLSSQLVCLVAGITLFWVFEDNTIISASSLVGSTILSRLGLRGFDLCAQFIVQDNIEAEKRGTFSSVEAAWQNAFEIMSYLSTIIFLRPEQFKWPSLISVITVASAFVFYITFVRLERGHLFHLEVFGLKGKVENAREDALHRIASESDV